LPRKLKLKKYACNCSKQINWLFPSENQVVTKNDFPQMARKAEIAPHIALEEFYKATGE
jgi:hypothetical protein